MAVENTNEGAREGGGGEREAHAATGAGEAMRQLAVGHRVDDAHADAPHTFAGVNLVVGVAVVADQHVNRLRRD